jgi:glycine C-acetyltransferase
MHNGKFNAAALGGSARDHLNPDGVDLLRRVAGFAAWQEERRRNNCWSYSRSTSGAPTAVCEVRGDAGETYHGVNFASQDYLSLSSHPAVKEAAREAIERFGVHSAGSSALQGNTSLSLELEAALSDFLGGQDVLIYPTGWAAGYGAVQGLVRSHDHIVMDVLTHNCMQEGARATTRNIHFHGHLNNDSVERKLRQIRDRDKTNAILVITEGLFSMNSDTPDLARLGEICRSYGATLLVDVAHDLGSMGDNGLGHVGLQNMLDKVDVLVGSFSKTFAANGGFVATRARGVKEYLKYYSSPATFSNALSPVQAAVVLQALQIVCSTEGTRLRRQLMDSVLYLREQASSVGLEVHGDPSPIVPIHVGAEGAARIATTILAEKGAIVNLVEFPAVPRGGSRFRLQVMASHSRDDVDQLISAMSDAVDQAEHLVPLYEPVGAATAA